MGGIGTWDSVRTTDFFTLGRVMMHHISNVAAVLLAAGGSSRLGVPKQLLSDQDGVPLVAGVVAQLLAAGCRPVIVVTGAIAEGVADALLRMEVTLVHNAAWAEGMGTSIAQGVGALSMVPRSEDVRGVLIAACDMPAIGAAHFGELIRVSNNGRIRTGSAYMSRMSVDDSPMLLGIPAIFPKPDWQALALLFGDRGARTLLTETGTLSVPSSQCTFDLDTPNDVAAWRSKPKT